MVAYESKWLSLGSLVAPWTKFTSNPANTDLPHFSEETMPRLNFGLALALSALGPVLQPALGQDTPAPASPAAVSVASSAATPSADDSQPTATASAVVSTTASEAAPAPAEPAATLVPADDANYDLLGEYLGSINQAGQVSPIGLQIRPIGGDRFEALQFTGGVPGAGADTESVLQLVGNRFGKSLILSGGPWAIFVDGQECSIVSPDGKKLGSLQRVERSSPTMGALPPEGATVLFDGSSTENFTVAETTADGLLRQGADVKPMFQDFNLHVEFRLPYMPDEDDQARGNSGCYLQSRYEVQVLDSFAQLPVFNGCSSLYRTKSPDVNMCFPPLRWQTYDIIFTAPRWGADGKKLRNARITVWHNGVKTQDDVELENKTGAGKPEEPTLLPIRFQNHKDPVRFRNIWIVDRGLATGQFPVQSPESEQN